jgi:hypothetical protein
MHASPVYLFTVCHGRCHRARKLKQRVENLEDSLVQALQELSILRRHVRQSAMLPIFIFLTLDTSG